MRIPILIEALECAGEQSSFEFANQVVINSVFRESLCGNQLLFQKQTCFDQLLWTHEQSITGKSRIARVWRSTGTRRPEWQDLPETLARIKQKVGKAVGCIAQIADTKAAW